jgi:hypothetical protein
MCEYNAPIVPADIKQNGLLFYLRFIPVREFTFNGIVYYINYVTNRVFSFHPPQQLNPIMVRKFNTYIQNNIHEFKPDTLDGFMNSMTHFSNTFKCVRYCNDPLIGMFCDPANVDSMLRFKLFFALGLLRNFLNSAYFKLMIRGGMALRMNLNRNQLISSHGLTDPVSASNADIDALVIVNPSIPIDQFEAFKTGFMKLLTMTIANSITLPDSIICRPATGDAHTMKIMVKKRYGEVELADTSFKYEDDNATVAMYNRDLETRTNIETYTLPFDLYGLNFKWTFPDLEALAYEYSYVVEQLEKDDPNPKNANTLKKFKTKRNIALGRSLDSSGGGSKKRTIRRKKHLRRNQ